MRLLFNFAMNRVRKGMHSIAFLTNTTLAHFNMAQGFHAPELKGLHLTVILLRQRSSRQDWLRRNCAVLLGCKFFYNTFYAYIGKFCNVSAKFLSSSSNVRKPTSASRTTSCKRSDTNYSKLPPCSK